LLIATAVGESAQGFDELFGGYANGAGLLKYGFDGGQQENVGASERGNVLACCGIAAEFEDENPPSPGATARLRDDDEDDEAERRLVRWV